MKPYISVVSPVYKSEESIKLLVEKIKESLLSITDNFEVILVEDASPDRAWDKILDCCHEDMRVKGIKLSRNFGQHYAITAGLEAATGEYIVVIDCDLQDDPRYISQMLKKSKEGFDIVYTFRKKRKFSFFKNLVTHFFYLVFNALTENKSSNADKNIGSYSLMTRKVLDAMLLIEDYHRHYLMVLRWLGFRSAFIEIEHHSRPFGKSSYNFKKLLIHALNGITSQSNKLLYFSIGIGLFIFSASILGVLALVLLYIIKGFKEGWASLAVLILLSTGLIMLSLGITGIYIGKIFDQVKHRPLYLVDQKVNLKD